jgi:cytochrome c6
MRKVSTLSAVAAFIAAGWAFSAGSALAQDTGEALFGQNCSACHQTTGQGIPGAFPKLAGNKFVQGPPQAVASVVLNGRGGMPTFADDLSDDKIAAILTYVRGAWGNTATPVTPAVVAAARSGKPPENPGAALQAH